MAAMAQEIPTSWELEPTWTDDEDEQEEQRQTKIDALMKEKPDDVFKRFDKDESGFIDYDEFVQMLPELGIKMTEAKALKYFRVCDSDGSGEIDVDEFKVALYACAPRPRRCAGLSTTPYPTVLLRVVISNKRPIY